MFYSTGMGKLRDELDQAFDQMRASDPAALEAALAGGQVDLSTEQMVFVLYRRIDALRGLFLRLAEEIDRINEGS